MQRSVATPDGRRPAIPARSSPIFTNGSPSTTTGWHLCSPHRERDSEMSVVLITGSCGLVGSESAAHYASLGYDVAGSDDDAHTRAVDARLQAISAFRHRRAGS